MDIKKSISVHALYGSVIRECRSFLKLSQAKIADSVGVSTSMWSRIESGDSPITLEYLRAAANSMGVKCSQICALVEHIEENVLPEAGFILISEKDILSSDELEKNNSKSNNDVDFPKAAAALSAGLFPLISVLGGTLGAAAIGGLCGASVLSAFAVPGKNFSNAIDLKSLVKEFIELDPSKIKNN